MRKLTNVAILGAFFSVFSLSAFAQSTPAPTGPADCKSTETWDQATKTCKPK